MTEPPYSEREKRLIDKAMSVGIGVAQQIDTKLKEARAEVARLRRASGEGLPTDHAALIAELHRAETLIENALALCAVELEPITDVTSEYDLGRRTAARMIRSALAGAK